METGRSKANCCWELVGNFIWWQPLFLCQASYRQVLRFSGSKRANFFFICVGSVVQQLRAWTLKSHRGRISHFRLPFNLLCFSSVLSKMRQYWHLLPRVGIRIHGDSGTLKNVTYMEIYQQQQYVSSLGTGNLQVPCNAQTSCASMMTLVSMSVFSLDKMITFRGQLSSDFINELAGLSIMSGT